jgi:hypothetical protein
MIKIKRYDSQNTGAVSITILWIFCITFTGSTFNGLHFEIGISLFSLQLTVGISQWRQLMP